MYFWIKGVLFGSRERSPVQQMNIPLHRRRTRWFKFAFVIFIAYWIVSVFFMLVYSNSTFYQKYPIAEYVFYPIEAIWPGGGQAGESKQAGRLKVQFVKARSEEIIPSIASSGKIEHFERIEIVSRIGGRIEKIFVNEGDLVEKGQLLIQIETLPMRLQILEQRAALSASQSRFQLAKARYQKAQRGIEKEWKGIERQQTAVREVKARLIKARYTYKGNKVLFEQGGISAEEFRSARMELISIESEYLQSRKNLEIISVGYRASDTNTIKKNKKPGKYSEFKKMVELNTRVERAELEVARSGVQESRASLQSTQLLMREASIRSPVKGFVSIRNKNMGEEVSSGASSQGGAGAILVLVDIERVYAVINIKESDIVHINKGMPLHFTVDVFEGEQFKALISSINPVVDEGSHTIEIKSLIENPKLKLRPNMFLRAKIIFGEPKQQLLVPTRALVPREKNKAWVFVLRDKQAFKVEVETGQEIDSHIVVKGGIKDGDSVAIEKLSFLRDAISVEAIFEKENTATDSK